MSADKLTVLLVDDHPVVKEGLSIIINAQEDMTVIGEASSGEEASSKAIALGPDVIVLDLKMPGMGGLTAIRKIKDKNPDARIVIFTTFGEEQDVVPAIEAGATGYILKGSASNEILQALRAVARGDSPIDPSAAKALISRVGKAQSGKISPLSGREIEVLKLMSEGLRNREIAEKLFIVEKTVKAHVGSILGKLNAPDRTAAVTKAIKMGIIEI